MRIKLYSILVYNLLFTQAPIPVCLDGTIIRAIIVAPDIIQELFFMVSRQQLLSMRMGSTCVWVQRFCPKYGCEVPARAMDVLIKRLPFFIYS